MATYLKSRSSNFVLLVLMALVFVALVSDFANASSPTVWSGPGCDHNTQVIRKYGSSAVNLRGGKGANSATFTLKNNCPYTVWPGSLTGGGSQLSKTGFELATGASTSVDAPAGWSGRFWARTGCSTDPSGKFVCATADCGSGRLECNGAGAIPPATLLEFTLNGDGGKDFYDVSLVDGFNLPASITPQGGGCSSTTCRGNVNSVCPQELSVKNAGGSVIACKSACEALRQPQYCCTGSFNKPETCPPTNYSRIFKNACPQAYSYAYDDRSSTFTCAAGGNYVITFCP